MSAPRPEVGRKCPVCGKPQEPAFRPFCSKRCAQIDLGRWLRGSYIIPGRDPSDADDLPSGRLPEEDEAS